MIKITLRKNEYGYNTPTFQRYTKKSDCGAGCGVNMGAFYPHWGCMWLGKCLSLLSQCCLENIYFNKVNNKEFFSYDRHFSKSAYIHPPRTGKGNKWFLCFIKSYGLESKNIGDN